MTLTDARKYLLSEGYVYLLSIDHCDLTYRYYRHPQYGTIADIHEWGDDARISYRMGTYENLFTMFFDDYLRRERGWEWAHQKADERARALALPTLNQADHAA